MDLMEEESNYMPNKEFVHKDCSELYIRWLYQLFTENNRNKKIWQPLFLKYIAFSVEKYVR